MARGRMLNQKISDDIEFNEMSMEHQFFFMRTLPFLDRDGLITGHPLLLPSKVLPLMPDKHAMFKEAVQVWIDAGFVTGYLDGKHPVLFFVSFAENQANMRYDRESPSEFAPPPGYKRTPKGLRPEGTPDESQTDDASSSDKDSILPDLIRQSSGPNPRIRLREDQDQEEEQHAGASHSTQPPQSPPAIADGEYMPGSPDPRQRKNTRADAAERFLEAKSLGVDAVQFRELVDTLLTGFGKKALVDSGNDKALYFAQDLTLSVLKMSKDFRTVEGVQSIFHSWYKHDWRGQKGELPTSEQFEEHASKMVDGVFDEKKPASTSDITFKQWCLRTYNADSPIVIGIPVENLRSQYEQATRVH